MNISLSAVRHFFIQNLSLKTLRSKFIIGFIFACLIAVGNIVVVKSLLYKSDTIAATVNMAGKMRMLGQRIGFMQLAIPQLENNKSRIAQPSAADFKEYEDNFENALNVLRHGGYGFGLYIPAVTGDAQNHLDRIETAWNTYLNALATIRSIILTSSLQGRTINYDSYNAAVVELIASSELLLINSEELINNIALQHKVMQKQVMHKIYGLFLINLLMLLIAGAVILYKVLKPIQRLMYLSNELSDGNYSVRLSLDSDDEFGSLSNVLNNSASHIEQLLHDIEIKKASLQQAEIKLQRSALVYEHISEAVVITDADGIAQDINPAFTTITGYCSEEMIGKSMNILSSKSHSASFYKELWSILLDTGRWRGDIRNKRKSGEEFIAHLVINTYFNDDGSVNCRIGLFLDVTEKRNQEALIWRQSRFDHLTQLPNRQMFHENLQRSIDQSHRSGLPFALIFLDLDWFKEVNDTFGHDEGDILLQKVAKRLSSCCRGSDQVARLGGDEFVVITQDLNKLENVRLICKKILDSISKPYTLSRSKVTISCSIGVTFYPNDAKNPTDLLKFADLAMYDAKEKGRNQYSLFSSSMNEAVHLRHELLRDLQNAVDTKQFVLYYQPIIDLRSGQVFNAEALIRWTHPSRGLISPAKFIPLAEDSGIIIPLGHDVFSQAIEQVSEWRNNLHKDFSVSINVSPAQFEHGGIDAESWINELQEQGLPGSAITIEITERLLLEIEDESHEKLQKFRQAGVNIALDDFGTGYSSISYLRRFNIDIIKIDQSFICDLAENSGNMALCKAIITMAHQLGMKVIAEGVETQQQHDLLCKAGCDFGQGYFYAKPATAEQFTVWMQNRQVPYLNTKFI